MLHEFFILALINKGLEKNKSMTSNPLKTKPYFKVQISLIN